MSLNNFITKVHSSLLCKSTDIKTVYIKKKGYCLSADDEDKFLIPCILTLEVRPQSSVFVTRNEKLIKNCEFAKLCSPITSDNTLKIFGFFSRMHTNEKRCVFTFYRDVLEPDPNLEMMEYSRFVRKPWMVKYNVSFLSDLIKHLDIFGNYSHIHFDFRECTMMNFEFERIYENEKAETEGLPRKTTNEFKG